MSAADPLQPTAAGPQPTPTVPAGEGTPSQPAGTPLPPGGSGPQSPDFAYEHPEALVGAAFAGSFLAARILKRITGGGS